VLAWLRARHEVCPQCGTTESDWLDPATRHYHDVPKWEATAYRCPGCAEVQRASEDVPDRQAGVRIVLIPARDHDDDEEGGTVDGC
jgi:predicted RNA-binding Zn-ribbon protein involved in translation (DUF1610 family)